MNLVDKIRVRLNLTAHKNKIASERWVVIVMGAYCSGKSILSKNAIYPSGVGIILEIAPDEMDTVERKINEAIAKGWRVLLELVFCDDPKLLTRRMVLRAKSQQESGEPMKITTIEDIAHSFIEVPKAAEIILERLREKIEFVSIDNSRSISEMNFAAEFKSPPIVTAIVEAQWQSALKQVPENE